MPISSGPGPLRSGAAGQFFAFVLRMLAALVSMALALLVLLALALWALPGFLAARMAKRRARRFGSAGPESAAAPVMRDAQGMQGGQPVQDVQDVPWRDVPGGGR